MTLKSSSLPISVQVAHLVSPTFLSYRDREKWRCGFWHRLSRECRVTKVLKRSKEISIDELL